MTLIPRPSILRNHDFLKLWGNQILLQVAFNMCNYSVLLILGDRTHSPFVQSQFYAVLTVPAFLFGLIAGPMVDVLNKKQLMLASDLFLSVLFLLYGISDSHVFFLLVIAFLSSSAARFFIPAEAATIPAMMKMEELSEANSLFLFTLLGSVLFGYSLAGPVIQLFGGLHTRGEVAPFVIGSILLLVGFFLRLSMKHVEPEKPKLVQGSILKKTLKLFLETISEVKGNRRISLPIILLVFVELNIGILSVVLLEYVRRYLLLPLTSVTYFLIIPLVLGLVIGTSFLKRIEQLYGQKRSIFLSCIGIGAIFLMLGILPRISEGLLWVHLLRMFSVISAFISGVFIVLVAVQSRTILQLNSPSSMQGRIFSFLDVMIALVTPLPVLVLGFFADRIGFLNTFLLLGLLVMLLSNIINKMIYA